MSVSCECCVLSGRGLCVGLINRPEKSYRNGVSQSDPEASKMRKPRPTGGGGALLLRHGKTICFYILLQKPDSTSHGVLKTGASGATKEVEICGFLAERPTC